MAENGLIPVCRRDGCRSKTGIGYNRSLVTNSLYCQCRIPSNNRLMPATSYAT